MSRAKCETRMKNSMKDNNIHICPICGSKNVNLVEFQKFYCINCCIEFDPKTNKTYAIMYDGTLVDYHINEFADLV